MPRLVNWSILANPWNYGNVIFIAVLWAIIFYLVDPFGAKRIVGNAPQIS
jgi:hypothetical protein